MKFICSVKLLQKKLENLRPVTDWVKSTELKGTTLTLTNSSNQVEEIEVVPSHVGSDLSFEHGCHEGFGWDMVISVLEVIQEQPITVTINDDGILLTVYC